MSERAIGRRDLVRENKRYTRFIARAFAEDAGKIFGAMEGNGVVVVVAVTDSNKARELREFVRDAWLGHIDMGPACGPHEQEER